MPPRGIFGWRRAAATLAIAVSPQIVAAYFAERTVTRGQAESETLREAALTATEEAHAAERSFARQVHAWKNMLLRADEPSARAAALAEFAASRQDTDRTLDRLSLAAKPLGLDPGTVETVRTQLAALTAHYTRAYTRLRPGDMSSLREVDLDVRGADRPLGSAIEALVVAVEASANAARASATARDLVAATDVARLRYGAFALSVATLALLYAAEARTNTRRLRRELEARHEAEAMHARAAAALAASEADFRNIFDNATDAFVRSRLDGQILLVNPAAVELLGYASADELRQKSTVKDLFVDPARRTELIALLKEHGHVDEFLAPWRRKDGTVFMAEGSVRLVCSESGEPIMVDGLVRDMTARLARDEALVHARQAAEQASQLKSQFLANMSHEIRTPLNAIVGLSQLALRTVTAPRELEYFRTIDASARGLLRILNDVLDLAKIESGRLDLERAPFDLDAILEDVSNVVAVSAEQKGLELVFAIDAKVPPVLVGDRTRLTQVLVNLASNAVKFTDRGEIVLSVRLTSSAEDRVGLHFSVRDTGIGLRDDDRSWLFVPFSQADGSTTRRHGGTGLGLAISRELVAKMGGTLDVSSAPGLGSDFFFEVELGVGPSSGVPGGRTLEALRGLRALVVDDSRTSRVILERTLASLSFEVSSFSCGEEAIAAIAAVRAPARPFDVVLVDWKMPDMDGLETARRVVAEAGPGKRPLVLMVSAYRMEEIRGEAESIGFDAFLAKPVSRSALVAALTAALSRRAGLPAAAPPLTSGPFAALRGSHVLVAEDHPINQQVISAILESAGISVEIVADGRRALEAVRRAPEKFAAILMDVQMPDMDGLEATRAILGQVPNAPPILAMTAHAFEAERAACLAAGMVDHVPKPVEPDRVLGALMRWARPRPSVPEGGLPGIDLPSVLERLGGNRGLVESLVARLRDEHGSDAATIGALLDRGDRAAARRMAHTLRGTAGNISARDVERAAGRIEDWLAAEIETTGMPSALTALVEDLSRALDVLVQRAGTGPATSRH